MLDSEDDWKDEVRKNRVVLVQSLEVSSVLDHLISSGVITLTQSESIREERSRHKKAELLLEYISRRPKADFVHFIKALRQTNQRHLVQYISGQRVQHGEEPWKQSLRVNLTRVVADLDVNDVLTHLISSGVLTMEQSEVFYQSRQTRMDKAQKLIELLERRTEADFWEFINALRNTGQDHIAVLLEANVPKRRMRNANDQFRPPQPANHPQSETAQDEDRQSQKRYKQEMEMDMEQEEAETRDEMPLFRLIWNSNNRTSLLASLLTRKLQDARHETIISHFSAANKAYLKNFEEDSRVVISDHLLEDRHALEAFVVAVESGTLRTHVLEMFMINDPSRARELINLTISIEEGMHTILLNYFKENPESVPPDGATGGIGSPMNEETSLSYQEETRVHEPKREPRSPTSDTPSSVTTRSSPREGGSIGTLFKMVPDKEYSVYDFEVELRRLVSQKMDIASSVNSEGFTLLHYIIYCARKTFLVAIFRCGLWRALYDVKVKAENQINSSELGGLTAMQIAEKRPSSRKMLQDMNFYNQWENSLPEISRLAREANVERVKTLLEDGVYQESNDHCGVNVLYWACVGGTSQLVQYLLGAGMSPRVTSESGETLLHVCASLGHSHILNTLLDPKYGLDSKALDGKGRSPLDRNAETGDLETLHVLAGRGVAVTGRVLPVAGFYGRLPFVTEAVEVHGAPVDFQDGRGQSALLRATEAGHIGVVRYLLSKRAELSTCNDRGRNMLHVVADVGNEAILKEVLQRLPQSQIEQLLQSKDKYFGAELCFVVRGRDKGKEAWQYVEMRRMCVDIFLALTRSTSGSVNVADYGTILASGWGSDPDVDVQALLERRFEEKLRENSTTPDSTPLHYAVFKQHEGLAMTLLQAGADPNLQDSFGMTPVHVAAMRGSLPLVRAMEEKGASLTIKTVTDQTPYEVAIANRHQDVANYLASKNYMARTQQFVNAEVPEFLNQLQPDQLVRVGGEGSDVRQHIVSVLREMVVGINGFLLDLGSGPVQEATSEFPNV